jgi:hypothetical protein
LWAFDLERARDNFSPIRFEEHLACSVINVGRVKKTTTQYDFLCTSLEDIENVGEGLVLDLELQFTCRLS